MFKKIFYLTLLLTLLFTVNAFAGAISISIDDVNVEFNNDSGIPFIDDSYRTQVPLRVTMEALGAKVEWDQKNHIAIVEKDGIIVKIPIWQSYIYVNDEITFNDTFAMIIDNRTYLPIRAVIEALGAKIDWNNDTRTVTITTRSDLKEEAIVVKENRYFSDINTISDFAPLLNFQGREVYYQDDGSLYVALYLYNGTDFDINDNFYTRIQVNDNDGNIIANMLSYIPLEVDLKSKEYVIKEYIISKENVYIQDFPLEYFTISTWMSEEKVY